MPDLFPEFDRVFCLSDLHLSLTGRRQLFFAGCRLAEAIRNLGEPSGNEQRTALVINGDFVDFLALEGASLFDRHNSPATLARIMDDSENQPVFDALAEFVRAGTGNILVIVVGNHDLELCLPTVQERLVRRLAAGSRDAGNRIRFVHDGTGFRCQVGGCSVLFMHGNEADPVNRVDHEALRQARFELTHGFSHRSAIQANLGTMLVTRVLHRIKKEYPFIDLLKPEVEDNLPLLDAVVDDLAGLLREGLATLGTYFQERMQWDPVPNAHLLKGGKDISASTLLEDDDELLLDVFSSLRNGNNDHDLAALDALENEMLVFRSLKLSPWGDFFIRRLGARLLTACGKRERAERARQRLLSLENKRHETFAMNGDDRVFQAVEQGDELVSQEIRILVAGHTHLRRCRSLSGGRCYYNTGTWTPLVRLDRQLLEDKHAFRFFVENAGRNDALKLFGKEWTVNGTTFPSLVHHLPTLLRISRAKPKDNAGCVAVLLEVEEDGTGREIDDTRREVQP